MLLAAVSLLFPIKSLAFTVQTFQPEGFVKSPRQARVVFSEPMVPFGDPRGREPFVVTCTAKGKGFWEDSRTWIYEFETELAAGESCAFKARADFRSEKGGAWSGRDAFSFETGGPAVMSSDPYEGSQVEQKPAFLLTLDGPVDNASVEKSTYVLVEGMAERIPIKVLPEKVRDEIVRRNGNYGGYEDPKTEGAYRKFIETAQGTESLEDYIARRQEYKRRVRQP